MRRPAQHRPGLAAAHGQALLYTDPLATAVLFNNDGGQGGSGTPPAPAAPSPGDLAARQGQQPPTPPAPAAAPGSAPSGEQEVSFTQRRLNKMMSEEKEEGRRAAYRAIAEAAGIDPDTFDPSKFGDVFKQAEQVRQQALSEEQRRTEELEKREQALQSREDAAVQREKEAADRDRASRIRAALVKLGATGDDLEDAASLLRVADDATDDDISQAAEKLKERRAEMFGGTATPQTLPPAPSGGPAGGNAPRQPASTKDAVREAARKRAEARGLRTAS
ncbi:hypothetical protein OIA45_48525 (plasmid) [Streptomyces chartreusis]|uniref:hypothetical protein n=1 Tax=Streptomyces chartreusis TaxID=1969 RepID=UPI0037DC108B|nr:hypothetical protein OIA45_48525 [Streptomyces chartreusis]